MLDGDGMQVITMDDLMKMFGATEPAPNPRTITRTNPDGTHFLTWDELKKANRDKVLEIVEGNVNRLDEAEAIAGSLVHTAEQAMCNLTAFAILADEVEYTGGPLVDGVMALWVKFAEGYVIELEKEMVRRAENESKSSEASEDHAPDS